MTHLLIVDDDPELRELTGTYLTRQGFDVASVGDATEMDAWLASNATDLVILDLMLPGEDGLSIARRLRTGSEMPTIPIIMLSAQGDDVDRIVGLEIGADDYLGKPFNPRELLARIRAVLRRPHADAPQLDAPSDDRIAFGDHVLDMDAHRLSRNGEVLALTTGEFDLLAVFARHPNRVLDRDRILDLLTGSERSPFDRSIDVRVTRLRSKIELDPSDPQYIRTVWGKGYMFCPDGQR